MPELVKRWLVFQGECYYPFGGAEDFSGSYDTKAEAVAVANILYNKHRDCTWAHVVDGQTMEIVHDCWRELVDKPARAARAKAAAGA